MASFNNLLGNTGQQSGEMQFQKFTPEQQNVLSQILQMGLGGVKEGLDFQPIEDRARTQFKEQTIPTIAERFTSMGAQRSSAFPQILGQAGAGLEESLAQMKSQHGLQRAGQLQGLLGMGLTPQFDTVYKEEGPGFLEGLGAPVAQSLGSLLPLILSGLFSGGASAGAGTGSSILSLLGLGK